MSSISGVGGEINTGMDKDQIVVLASVTICALGIAAFIFWGPDPRPRRRGALIGLQNLGLTCFLNTLLQAMASCPMFLEWLESCHEQGNVATSLFYILKVLSSESCRLPESVEDPLAPHALIDALRQHGWAISRGEQDAHELFHLLMVTLEEEAHKAAAAEGGLADALEPKRSRVDSAPPTITDVGGNNDVEEDNENHNSAKSSGDSVMVKSLPPTLRLLNKNGDVITRSAVPKYDVNRNYQASPFCGMLTSQLQCVQCGFKSVLRFDKFDSLSLHLPESPRGRHTLTHLLDNFTRTEEVTGVACDGCNRERDPAQPPVTSTSLKTLSIGKLPKCLCIHIHRMSMASDGTPYKRRDYIDFPEYLIMDPYTHNSSIKVQKTKEEAVGSTKEAGSSTKEAGPSTKEDSNSKEDNNLKILAYDVLPCRTGSGQNIYRLKAVVVHSGTVDSGHFFTYRRGPLQSNTRHRWYLTSDETVKDSSLAEALKATAYMLFYEKCTMTPT